MKKIFKLFILVIFTILFIPNVYATEITLDRTKHLNGDEASYYVTNKGNIVINGVVANDQFQAFRMIETYYNEDTNEISYQLTELGRNFFDAIGYDGAEADDIFALDSGDITSGNMPTSVGRGLDYFSALFAAYIKQAGITGIPMTVDGTTATVNVDAGTYMVLPTVTSKVYAAMVGNVEFRENSGEWNLVGTTIQAKVSDAGINKYIKETLSREGTFGLDDRFTYVINVTLPTYPGNATNKEIYITEESETPLRILGIVVKDGDNELTVDLDELKAYDEDGHVVVSATMNGDITIVIDTDYVDTNNLTIEYMVKLRNSARLGPDGNSILTTLTYSNDPYGTGTFTTDPIEVVVYTYGIDIFSKNSDDEGLNNAVYDICTDSACNDVIGTITTGSDGHGTLSHVKEGTYYIKQTKAPTGYKLDTEIRSFTIDNTTDYTEVPIVNERMSLLPATGGIGTYIFIGIGFVVVVFALLFLFLNRRKKGDNNEENK